MYDKQHQYTKVARWSRRMIKVLVASSATRYNDNYIYALLMDQDFGVMDGLISNILDRCPTLLKAKKEDSDLLNVRQALSGPHRGVSQSNEK